MATVNSIGIICQKMHFSRALYHPETTPSYYDDKNEFLDV